MAMAEERFDVVVIGAGPGGYVAANRAGQLGMKIAVIERDAPGGICLNWGCIPTKALLKAAEVYHEVKDAGDFGITVEKIGFDFAKVMERSRAVANRLSGGIKFLFEKFKVQHIAGTAAFVDAHNVTVKGADGKTQKVTGKHIIIATGARPRAIPGVEFDGKRVLNYFHALALKELPKKIIIIGAGAIGVEFAYFWSSFGAEITIIEMLPQLLPIEDEEVATELRRAFQKQKMKIMTGTRVEKVRVSKTGVEVHTSKDGKTETVSGDVVLVAIGVQANSEELNLPAAGIKTERGFISVDKTNYRTSAANVYAIGDCIATPLLAHVAMREGETCVDKIAGHDVPAVDYGVVPGCTYCQPQVASVGLTEKAALAKGHNLKIGKFPFRAIGKAVAVNNTNGFVKLIFDADAGTLLGAHIIGHEATEMIAELVMAKNFELTYREIIKTMHAHPTLSEAIFEAAALADGSCVHM